MTPTHTNKQGARYRYYVSHTVLQKRAAEAGNVTRVPAHDVETLVVKALREQLDVGTGREHQGSISDRELIDQWVDRIVVNPQELEIHFKDETEQQAGERNSVDESCLEACRPPPSILTVPWSHGVFTKVKGILHSPSSAPTVSPESRDLLLTAIAKARAWIDDLVEGRIACFAEIAKQEGKVERHVRFLAPLAFVSPRSITTIIDRSAPANLTVTDLAKAAAHSWAEECRRFGL